MKKKVYSLFLRPSRTLYVRSVNARSTGGLFGKCVIVFGCAGMICSRTAELFLVCNKIPLESSAVEQLPSCFIFQLNSQIVPHTSKSPIAADRSISRACRVFLRNVVSRSMNHPFRAGNTRENSVPGDLFFTTCNIARPHDAMHFAFQADMLKIAFLFWEGEGKLYPYYGLFPERV